MRKQPKVHNLWAAGILKLLDESVIVSIEIDMNSPGYRAVFNRGDKLVFYSSVQPTKIKALKSLVRALERSRHIDKLFPKKIM